MVVTTDEGRRRIAGDLAEAISLLELSLACFGEAFEMLATGGAERMETALFRPAQKALARAKRTHAAFTSAHGLEAAPTEPASPGPSSQGAKVLIERGVTAALEADNTLAELQDSMLPVEVGGAELRAGLAEVRELLAPVALAARELLRGLGR